MHAGIVAELHGDLSKAGVDARDGGSPPLQQAVGKSARGSADVDTMAARYGNAPVIECAFQLEAAAADVAQVLPEKANRGFGRYGRARLVDLLLVGENAAGENKCTGALPTLDEAAFDQKHIDAGLGWHHY